MKTRLLFIMGLLLITLELTARHADATFKTNNGASMIVFIDGNRINSQPMNIVKLNKLYAGRHHVRIKVIGRRFSREINRPIQLKKDHKTKFVVNSVGRRGNLQLVKVDEKPIHHNNYKPYPKKQNRYDHREKCHVGYMVNMDKLLHGLEHKRFDSKKIEFVRLALANKSLYTRDLLEILNNVTFESTKLDIAIFAHQGVVDKDNFHLIYDVFKFRSSIRELEKYSHDDSWF